jgi:hypothetical protein
MPFMAGLSGFGLLILASSLALRLSSRTEALGGTMFAAGGVGVLYLWLWIRNARLLVGQGVIGQRNLVGQTRTLATSDIGHLVIATVVFSKNATPQRGLYVLATDGRQLMALNTRAWGDEAIGKLVEASGKAVEYRDGPISASEFRAEFPHAVSWWAIHSTLLGALMVVVGLGIAIGIPIALVLVHR